MTIEFNIEVPDCVLTLNLFTNEIILEFFDVDLIEEVKAALNRVSIFYESPTALYIRIPGRRQRLSINKLAKIIVDGITADGYTVVE